MVDRRSSSVRMIIFRFWLLESGIGFCGLLKVAAKGASWIYRFTASDPHRPMSWMASREYPILDRNWAPETLHRSGQRCVGEFNGG